MKFRTSTLCPHALTVFVCGAALAAATMNMRASGQDAGSGSRRVEATPAELGARLAHAVDLPTANARRRAALDLAKDTSVPIEEWMYAAESFAPREPAVDLPREMISKLVPVDEMYQAALKLPVDKRIENVEVGVYVPRRYDASVAVPLLVFLHPARSDGPDLMVDMAGWFRQLGFLVLAPTQTVPDLKAQGAFERELGAMRASLRWMRRHYNVDENRIFVAGVSRGGQLAWDWCLRSPDQFAGAGFVSACPHVDAESGRNTLRYSEHLSTLPQRLLIGELESPAVRLYARESFDRMHEAGADDAVWLEESGAGHNVDFWKLDWKAFFNACERDPMRDTIVRLFAAPGEGRAFWADVIKARPKQVQASVEVVVPDGFVPDGADGQPSLEQAFGLVCGATDAATARLQVTTPAVGQFHVELRDVLKFRILLTPEMLADDGSVEVSVNGKKPIKRKPKPSVRVLLSEFVERFDRTFLPTAEFQR